MARGTAKQLEEQMISAAWMHYDEGLTHEQIAARLRLSRVKVTRLLQRALREGIVQIRIVRPRPFQYQLERRLEERFGLRRAIVVPTSTPGETLDAVGRAGAEYLREILTPGCRLGVGWSTTVKRMEPYLEPPRKRTYCSIVELAGSHLRQTTPYTVSWRIARVLGQPLETLPVPVVVQSHAAREAILQEEAIRTTLDHAKNCDIAIVGLGDVAPNGTMVRTGYLTEEDMADLRRRGAVGDILMRHYDAEGRYVASPLDGRIVSLGFPDICRIPHIVAMAVGSNKVEPILGAVRGKLCHSLITDTDTAVQVLERVGEKL